MGFSIFLAALLALTPAFTAGTHRSVYVFGYMALDFTLQWESAGLRYPLRDCSDETLFCADGEVFNIVLPRICGPIAPGTSWRAAGMETRVIAPSRLPVALGTIYYLHTDARPDVVFAYSHFTGVARVYYDPRGRHDFAAMAREGRLDRFTLEASGDPERDPLVMELITLHTFAECRRASR